MAYYLFDVSAYLHCRSIAYDFFLLWMEWWTVNTIQLFVWKLLAKCRAIFPEQAIFGSNTKRIFYCYWRIKKIVQMHSEWVRERRIPESILTYKLPSICCCRSLFVSLASLCMRTNIFVGCNVGTSNFFPYLLRLRFIKLYLYAKNTMAAT